MLNPRAVYIHIPFCEVKCGYCDFYSVPRGWKEFDLQEAYVEALCREIDGRCRGGPAWPPSIHGQPHRVAPTRTRIKSIFLGGGTPSLLRVDLLEKILNKLNEHFEWDANTEITMECNPKTIDLEGLRQRRQLGINRLSLGVQSFQDRLLKVMGRIHSADDARHTIDAAFKAGFENVNFDMIFALPGQTLEDWQKDLETALELGTPHLSCYNLTIEAGTPFASIYKEPDDDTALAMFRHTRERLAAAGLNAYEISNFARPGHECVHNQNYWDYGEYMGFGVSASSFRRGTPPWVPTSSHPERSEGSPRHQLDSGRSFGHGPQDDIRLQNLGRTQGSAPTDIFATRSTNIRDLNKYIVGAGLKPAPTDDPIDTQTAMGEFVMLSLRTREGLSEQRFEELFGEEFEDVFSEALKKLLHVGARRALPLQKTNCYWHFTERGLELADSVIGEFI